MLFNTLNYMVFFAIVFALYFIMKPKYRWAMLLISSYYFYMSWNIKYALIMLTSTAITFASGMLLEMAEKASENKRPFYKRTVVFLSLASNLGILFFFKYYSLFLNGISAFSQTFSLNLQMPQLNFLLPIGISFYTFQALSYTIDVYRGEVKAERNFGKYALFVSFFPPLVAGPIERSKTLLPQFNRVNAIDIKRINAGLIYIGLGLFKKVVIADRLALLVNTVYDQPTLYKGFTLIIATIFFSIQIYCDFSGYSDIAVGSAKILGYDLTMNFRQPYFSKSISEFWRRWHITLGTWFRDYLYIPLGGNKVSRNRRYFNLMVVFLVSGLWHGATIMFVIWGALHGAYQVIGLLTRNFRARITNFFKADTKQFGYRFGQACITYTLTCFAWIFFRAGTWADAKYIVRNIFNFNYWVLFDDSLFLLGLDWKEFMLALFAILILLLIDWLSRNGKIIETIQKQPLIFRWVLYLVFIFVIIIFGSYGESYEASNFLYFQF